MKKFSFGELKIMVNKINIGIVGYGNLGRAVEKALMNNDDLKLEAIFTRRNTKNIISNSKLLHISEMKNYIGSIDVMILCGGSATDLPQQSAEIAKYFNVVDSFDTHAKIEEHFREVDEVCKENKKIALLSVGWDPGLFSLNRLLGKAIIPNSTEYTFWGKGVSQGHSDAIRRIKGVKMAIQYTIPIKEVIEKVRGGEKPILSDGKMHKRVCYVVAEEGADLYFIENSIKNMPYYFAGYETEVNFITEEEFKKEHRGMPHGGFVICSGNSGENNFVMEFKLSLDSNPEFTGSVLVAYARAMFRMYKEGKRGAYTIFDVPPSYLLSETGESLRKKLL